MKIPVEDAVENTEQAAAEATDQVCDSSTEAAASVDGAEVSEGVEASEGVEVVSDEREADAMTEEEMVEAAIRAGEEAANDDFKMKYELAQKELAELRAEFDGAAEAKAAAEEKAADAVNRHARLQADWENYRRRTAQERLDERARATEKVIEALLPVVDDMERALDHARSQEMADDFRQFVDGVDAVREKILTVFDHEGVEVIDPKGEGFDPNIHQAVGRVEDASQYDETVNDVYQKGYRMGGKVVRPAMVTVTYGGDKRPAPEPEPEVVEESGATETAAE